MTWKSDYLLVCDERGTTRWPSSSRTWALGGYITQISKKPVIENCWLEVKEKLCGTKTVELKWSHLFAGRHQEGETNPLISTDPKKWKEQAVWAIKKIFSDCLLEPINIVVRKDQASDTVFVSQENRTQNYGVLDIETIWVGIIGRFASFLNTKDGRGEIWSDELGSRAEEKRRNEDWTHLRNEPWPINRDKQIILSRISPDIRYFDSDENELVQVADFISGVIWAASEGDESFLLESLSDYFPYGPNSPNLLIIQ